MKTDWKFTSASRDVVARTLDDGSMESGGSTREDVLAWVAAGNTILGPDPLPLPTQAELDAAEARADAKLGALAGSTPAQIRAWANNNFPTLTAAERDKLGTAFVALCILARRI